MRALRTDEEANKSKHEGNRPHACGGCPARQRAVDAERTERIKDLYQQYPHFVDLSEEMEACLYSHGSDMGSEAFDKHLTKLEKYAKNSSPTTRMLPGGDAGAREVVAIAKSFRDRVLERATLEADSGNPISWETAEALVRKEMTGA